MWMGVAQFLQTVGEKKRAVEKDTSEESKVGSVTPSCPTHEALVR